MQPLRVNVLGFGVMGRQISALLGHLGCDVTAWNRTHTPEAKASYDATLRLTRRKVPVQTPPGRVELVSELGALEPGVTIETLSEDLDIKRRVVASLPYDPLEAALFTNTSSLAPGSILRGATGLHFFNPVHRLKLVELAPGEGSLSAEGTRLLDCLAGAGYEVVRTGTNPGYIGNYMLFHEISAVLKLIELHGYGSDEIDRVSRHLGHASVLDVIDLIGVEVTLRILEQLHAVDPAFYVSPSLGKAIERNVLGTRNKTSIRSIIGGKDR